MWPVPVEEYTMKEIHGAGYVEYLNFYSKAKTNSHKVILRVYCDGDEAFEWDPIMLNTRGYTSSTPGISLLKYGVDGDCVVHLTLRFEFQRHLKITVQPITAGCSCTIEGLVNLIR